ncbi:MAG: HAD family hydrolase [Planctomycetota bacterium]
MEALIFDCDGVLVDTETDGHRVAFNQAFAAAGLDVEWNVELYGQLLAVAGGKERMTHYFNQTGWPDGVTDRDGFIKQLHKLKTDRFMNIIASGQLPLRPGVARLIDEAIAAGGTLAVCSTSNERAVHLVVDTLLGPERKAKFGGIFAGDMVPRKKPDPAVYNLATSTLGLTPAGCLVVEDSENGLRAAKAAGMPCVVTVSTYTGGEDFSSADRVVEHLDDGPVTLADLQTLVKD